MQNANDIKISVLNFTEYPGPRYIIQGADSGEDFYHKVLNKAFYEAYTKNVNLVLDLDNTAGYPPSFLDEAVGNLVYDFTLTEVKKRLVIISEQEPDWKEMIEGEVYSNWQERIMKKQLPVKTVTPKESWYRLVDGQVKLDKWI